MIRLAIAASVALSTAIPAWSEIRVPDSAIEIQLSFAPVVRHAAPAVVNVYAKRVVADRLSPFADDPFFSQFFGAQPRVQNSLGSGVILDPSGIVVSNFHVVGDATQIRVVLSDRREFDAEVILADRESDIAVLQLDGAGALPALEIADSDGVEVGDLVLAIGNPFGVGQTVSSGIVSGLARSGGFAGIGTGYFIQTDAPINPGNSGGALVDMAGRLVGINTSILTRSGGSNGIGFAIPANLVAQYVAQAQAGQDRLIRPWAGIEVQTVDASLAGALDLARPEGVLIARLHPESPFADAGLAPGAVILTLDGAPVDGAEELDFRLATLGPGGTAEVEVLDDGQRRAVEIALAPPPETPPRAPLRIESGPFTGLRVATVNPGVIEAFDLPLTATGTLVLDAAGPAARSGLRPGDILVEINGQAVTGTDRLQALVTERRTDWQILLERGGQRSLFRLRSR